MNARVDAANRAVLTLLGLLFLAAGGLGLATGFGAFGADPRLLPRGVRDYAARSGWFWWAVGAGCLVVALLGLRWLVSQLRSDRVGRLDLTEDDREGLTVLHTGALTDAVEDEAETLRGVTGASAALRSRRGRRLLVTVDLAEFADIAEVRNALEGRVVPHARQATDEPGLPVEIELRPGRQRSGDRGLR